MARYNNNLEQNHIIKYMYCSPWAGLLAFVKCQRQLLIASSHMGKQQSITGDTYALSSIYIILRVANDVRIHELMTRVVSVSR